MNKPKILKKYFRRLEEKRISLKFVNAQGLTRRTKILIDPSRMLHTLDKYQYNQSRSSGKVEKLTNANLLFFEKKFDQKKSVGETLRNRRFLFFFGVSATSTAYTLCGQISAGTLKPDCSGTGRQKIDFKVSIPNKIQFPSDFD